MRTLSKTWVAAAAAMVGASCTGNGTLKVDGRVAEPSVSSESSSTSLPIGDGALVLESARISVSELEFEGGPEESDELEAELGAAVINLALDGQPTTIAADSVEAGSYHTFGMELRRGGPAEFGGALPASIIVSGRFGDAAFSYRSEVAPELEFSVSVEVPEGGEASVAVPFDLAAWFAAADGSVLDPSDEVNRETIENNIMQSLRVNAQVELDDDD